MEVPLTPLDFARRARRLYADREAVVDGDLRLTYTEFFDRIDRWSSALQGFGVAQGDRVAYIAPNTHAQLEGFYAVPQIGAVLVPVNYRLTADDFAYIINHCGARIVCVHSDFLDAVEGIRERLPQVEQFVALEGAKDGWVDYEATVASSSPAFLEPEIAESDLLTINYTSGTTARPKGVMLTHRNNYINAVGTMAHYPLEAGVRYLWTLPMFHVNGWTFVWIITARGGAHVCLRRVDPATVFDLIAREQIGMFCAAPTILISLASASEEMRKNAPRGVRLLTAGAPPAAATIARIEGELGWNLTQVYGLTETSPFITFCEERPEHQTLTPEARSVIKARQGVELMTSGELVVVDENDMEVPHDGQTLGEITVRGNVVMKGYYDNPGATAAAIRGGRFYTGDAAVVHPDGYVEIRDRFKDVIISGGENISSVEIEGALLHHPAVLEVAVVGMPHEKWGESPHAFVVLRAGETATEDELKQFVRDRLAHFKTPQWVTVVSDLPKTATGKVQKYVLRQDGSAISRQ
jgi:fatty-acyl-CoA synthase